MFEKRRFPWHIPVIAIIGILVLASGVYIGLKSGQDDNKIKAEVTSKIDRTNTDDAMDISEECEIWVVKKYPDGTPVEEDGGSMVGIIPKDLVGKSKNYISEYLSNEYPNREVEKISKYEIISNILNDLYNIGIDQEDIQTIDISIRKVYDYEEGKQIFRGYEVVHILRVTVRNIDQVGEVYTIGIENGANSDVDIKFTVSNIEDYYNRALQLAVKDAVDKAKLMANTLGVRIRRIPKNISEVIMSQTPPPRPYVLSATKEVGTTPISEGTMDVRAEVNSEFCTY